MQVSFDEQENGLLYLNATNVAKEFGKNVNEWKRLPSTIEYMETLVDMGKSHIDNLVISIKGGAVTEQGTWIHKSLIVLFARWLNIRFAIWCDEQIENILTKNKNNNFEVPEVLNYLAESNEAKDVKISKLESELQKALIKKTYNVITPIEHNQIKEMFESGFSIPKMEKELELTRNQVEQSLKKQGLYLPNLESDKLLIVINHNYYYNSDK